MNKYKIDTNEYGSESYPFSVYVKSRWYNRWKHLCSFKTYEEALGFYQQHYAKYNLPTNLN